MSDKGLCIFVFHLHCLLMSYFCGNPCPICKKRVSETAGRLFPFIQPPTLVCAWFSVILGYEWQLSTKHSKTSRNGRWSEPKYRNNVLTSLHWFPKRTLHKYPNVLHIINILMCYILKCFSIVTCQSLAIKKKWSRYVAARHCYFYNRTNYWDKSL